MRLPNQQSTHFLLEVFDREQWCPVFQARFEVPDLGAVRALLGAVSDDDPDLGAIYSLDAAKAGAIASAFGIDIASLDVADGEFHLQRWPGAFAGPYLVHTGYELPLLLDGRKKLARMHAPSTAEFGGEHRFDHWVAAGVLHREEVLDPFAGQSGHRTVYYTPKGEEWRIPAMKLIYEAAQKAGRWNEHFERLESMLFGYEDWQTEWWINTGLDGGGFGGLRLCCTVNKAGLSWIETAGFRALPPTETPSLALRPVDAGAKERTVLLVDNDSVAVASFVVAARGFQELVNIADGPPWHLAADRIPKLNQLLLRPVSVRRRDAPKS